MPRPALGEKRTIKMRAERQKRRIGGWWDREITWSSVEIKPVEGIYIGWRTVFDGGTEYLGDEEGIAFHQDAPHEVWLFVTNPRHNPIRVFPDDSSFVV